MSSARHWEQDKDSTLYVGNLDERCTDALVWELMLQAGPVINVHLPKDRVTQTHQGYGFVEFGSEEDADYAVKIMNQIRLWGKPIRVNKASADKRGQENGGLGGSQGVGAELFVGNLDTLVDEKTLYETFSRFGPLVAAPKVARDESNLSKGYGFVSYATFESSDEAIAHMHGQFLMNKEVTVQYAYKKDGKGERHGDAAERALAAQARKHGIEVNVPALPAALVMPTNTPSAPAAMSSYPSAPTNGTVRPPFMPNQFHTPQGYGNFNNANNFPAMPMPMSTAAVNGTLPNRQMNHFPLAAPPSAAGLPARPPPSMVGYGGPTNAPGFQHSFQPGLAPPNFPPPTSPAAGMPPPGLNLGFRNQGPQAGFQPPT